MHNFFRIIFAFAILSGCSTVSNVTDWVGGDEDNTAPPTPLTEINTLVKIIELWEKDVGSGSDDQYLKLSPAISGDKIYVANNSGDIQAIDIGKGNIIWNKDVDKRISGGPGANNGLIIAGTSEGEVITVNSETGEILWETRVSSEILSAPQTDEDVVVVRTIDGKIFGLNAIDGHRLWVYDRSVPALTLRGTSAPVIADGLVIAGFASGRLSAIELKTGKVIWETSVAVGSGRSELERMVDIDAEPLIIDGIIYVATFQGRIAAMDMNSGGVLWTRDISSFAGINADEKHIYITDENSHVWALDRVSGNSVWKQEKLEARKVTAPAPINELVVVGDVEGYLHWLDKSTGQFVARTKVSSARIIAPPISTGDIVFAYSSDGTLGAYTNHPLEKIIQIEEAQADAEPALDVEAEQETTAISDPQKNESSESTEIVESVQSPPAETSDKEEKSGLWGRMLEIFTGSSDEDDEP